MQYRRKLIALSVLVGTLALVYSASLIFDPELRDARSASFSLLDNKALASVTRIVMSKGSDLTNLEKRDGRWLVLRDATAFPAKAERVTDLLSALSAVAVYPRVSSTASAHEALALTDGEASRITVFGSAEKPLLDLLLGEADAAGKNVHLRFAASDETFSGLDRFSSFFTGAQRSWFNLAFFAGDPIRPEDIQRISVRAKRPMRGESAGSSSGYTLARDAQRGWLLEGKRGTVDTMKADAYAKVLSSAEADDFADADGGETAVSIIIETGDGRSRTIDVSEAGADGRSVAAVSGSAHRYSLGQWNVERLVRDESHFLAAER